MPKTLNPAKIEARVTARIAAFMPGASPPDVRIPTDLILAIGVSFRWIFCVRILYFYVLDSNFSAKLEKRVESTKSHGILLTLQSERESPARRSRFPSPARRSRFPNPARRVPIPRRGVEKLISRRGEEKSISKPGVEKLISNRGEERLICEPGEEYLPMKWAIFGKFRQRQTMGTRPALQPEICRIIYLQRIIFLIC